MIQELKNHLHQVFKFSESSLLRTKQEAEKQQKVDYRASQARLAKTQQDILALRAQYHNLVMENREAEQALRKVPGGLRGTVWGRGRARDADLLGGRRGKRPSQERGARRPNPCPRIRAPKLYDLQKVP